MRLSFRSLQSFVFLGILATALCVSASANAAEQVVVKYKIFRASIPVDELTTFAKTGEASSGLKFYIRASRQDPDDVRRVLSQEADVNVVTLDRALNNPAGELLLDQISLAVHTPSNTANREAIRSALVLSASQDNKMSLIEVIQNYPTSEVEVEGERVLRTSRQFGEIWGQIQNVVGGLTQP
jgi:Alpha/beta hydrolase of unknown function (DUF1400)